MESEIKSFFDNEGAARQKSIWSDFQEATYEHDHILIGGQCIKISRKSQKPKQIHLELGHETLYFFKDKPKGMLNLVVTKMESIKTDIGPGFRLIRNQQVFDVVFQDLNKWKNLLSQKCLQTTFHEEFGVTKMIGKGSFAKVYLATKKSTGVNYAIKAFNKEFMTEQFKGKESLENEIKVMRRLNQDNLVKLYEAYETQNSIYFVLDVLKGGELLHRVRQNSISTQDLQKLMYNLMKALAHLHSKKCMHRDLKPENLLLKDKDNDYDIVIADFGLATFINEDILFKRCGTPGFVAPEILLYKEGDPFYDEKCDVFSAGVIFYLLITGKQPFQGADYKAILRANKNCEINYGLKQIVNVKFKYLCFFIKQSPPNQLDLLKRMLQPEPKLRISSEECLKHTYFSEIYNEKDLIESRDNLALYEIEYLHALTKKTSQSSAGSMNFQNQASMDLQQRQPAMNGNVDTLGTFSNVSHSSISKIEQSNKQQLHVSKFSQFCSTVKQESANSPQYKKNNQSDLHKIALKNSLQKQIQSKDDDFINEEGAQLEDAVAKLNSQSPKLGMLKKSSSYKIQKTTQSNE